MATLIIVYKSSTGVVTTPVEEIIYNPRKFPGVIIYSDATRERVAIPLNKFVALLPSRE